MDRKLIKVVAFSLLITLSLLWWVRQEQMTVGSGSVGISPPTSRREELPSADTNDEPTVEAEAKATASRGDAPAIRVTFLDIGQGDATFIEWPDGTQMLIDCAKDTRVLGVLGRVLSFYDRTIDYLVVTHPDLDHYGGCTDVLSRYDIKNIVYTGVQKNDPSWEYFWEKLQSEGAEYHKIDREEVWEIGGAALSFLYPDHNVEADASVPGFAKSNKDNNGSIVIKLSFGESDVLFTGDAEAALEEYLVKKLGDRLNAEVLKVAHHGSGGSSVTPFIQAVNPKHAVISVGVENDYGHPSLRVLRRLERAGSRIWRTDINGDVKLLLYPDRLEVGSRK